MSRVSQELDPMSASTFIILTTKGKGVYGPCTGWYELTISKFIRDISASRRGPNRTCVVGLYLKISATF